MELTQIYNKNFYGKPAGSNPSAEEILSYVDTLLHPKSVIDVGCGVGSWLKAWQDINPNIAIAGIDGNEVVSQFPYISSESYKQVDLTQNYQITLQEVCKTFSNVIDSSSKNALGGGAENNTIENKIDSSALDSANSKYSTQSKDSKPQKPFALAQSIEVAEHLYAQYAQNLIDLLTSLSDIVLFSAAIPYQGGTHHVNEQPPIYWAKLFAKKDFVCFDILRDRFWENTKIAPCYRQNMMIYVHKSKIDMFKDFSPTTNPLYI
ncbi:hypothetical protein, partial [uncultured Helicobacter sp.]